MGDVFERDAAIEILLQPVRLHDKYSIALDLTKPLDVTTQKLLFKEAVVRDDEDFLGRYEDNEFRLENWMYGPVQQKRHSSAKIVSKTRVKAKVSRTFKRGGSSLSSYSEEPEEHEIWEGSIEANNYGLGGQQHGYRKSSNKFLEDQREHKFKLIRSHYERLFVEPVPLEQARSRQALYSELLGDERIAQTVSGLETSLNHMQEPYRHLSNMANLISSRLLKSRWGDALPHKQEFFNDFVRIGRLFIAEYDAAAMAASNAPVTTSADLDAVVSIVQAMTSSGPLQKAYAFLKGATQAADFAALEQMFKDELHSSGATLHPELEKYDPYRDPYRYMATKRASLQGEKSPRLLALLQRFHSQNPVTGAQEAVADCDTIGTKLAAYTAVADFIKQYKWTRPELLDEDGVVDIRGGWYPIVKPQHTPKHIPNPTYLDAEHRLEVIDGPNVGGKTVDMKKTLFIAATALAGNYVPAQSARISYFDRIIFRLKSPGTSNRSAMIQEIESLGPAMPREGERLLAGLDETWTSTNDVEGEALTWGIMRRYLEHPGTRAIITSHYPSLQEIQNDERFRHAFFSHFEYTTEGRRLKFNHEKKIGPNRNGDYAIVIAEHEGLDPRIISFAKQNRARYA
jgi:hypothetical protein